jgi:hypothetical protein
MTTSSLIYFPFEICWICSEEKIKGVTRKLNSLKQEINNKLATMNKGIAYMTEKFMRS